MDAWTQTWTHTCEQPQRRMQTDRHEDRLYVDTHTQESPYFAPWVVGLDQWHLALSTRWAESLCSTPSTQRHKDRLCLRKERLHDKTRRREVQKKGGKDKEKCWNSDFWDVSVRFEINKQRKPGEGEPERDETKGCGKMEKDRWGEGKRERNGGWPDGTPLSNFWQLVGGISLGNSISDWCVCLDTWLVLTVFVLCG